MARDYWLDLFSWDTWSEFLKAGGRVSGFREFRWKTVQRMARGDYLLCYLTGISRFIGLLRVTGEPYKDKTPIWSSEDFPSRIPVKILIQLKPETAVPVLLLREKLEVFRRLRNPHRWSGAFRGSPSPWTPDDGETVVQALRDAEEDPVERRVDPSKLKRRPRTQRSKIGPVTVVSDEDEEAKDPGTDTATEHTEIQWLLLKLGADLGLDVWVARNDRGKRFRNNRLADLPGMRTELPRQFDEATQSIIELIDVLWLRGNAILASFEIESTTSIYSGLLRMADLVAMQPNLNIPLYLVAPEERRDKVIAQVNRPAFSRLRPPLAEICRFISFAGLKSRIAEASPLLQFMKPDFIEDISEPLVLE